MLWGLSFLLLATAANGGCTAVEQLGILGNGRSASRSPSPAALPGSALDRDDCSALAADFLGRLQATAFWQQTIATARKRPAAAVWPIDNSAVRESDPIMPLLLWSLETALGKTRNLSISARSAEARGVFAKEVGVREGAPLDTEAARKLGRRLNIEYLVTGRLTTAEVVEDDRRILRYSLYLQMLDVDSGIIRFHGDVTRDKPLPK